MSDDDMDDLFTKRRTGTVVREGAAGDAAEPDAFARLPRILRYASLAEHDCPSDRVLAEVVELAPELAEAATAWAEDPRNAGWKDLSASLDKAAVERDSPALRGLADAVRLVSMDVGDTGRHRSDALRVIAGLRAAIREPATTGHPKGAELVAEFEMAIVGWYVMVSGERDKWEYAGGSAHRHSVQLGRLTTNAIRTAAADEAVSKDKKRDEAVTEGAVQPATVEVPDGHVLVCPAIETKGHAKNRDVVKGHEGVIGTALPLTPMPDIAAVRQRMIGEFPYAADAVDALLAPMVGRTYVGFPPVVLVGPPGAGKSHMANRLAHHLAVGTWRTDAARADGNCFGGTDRRWWSTEPCHSLLAISRSKTANPLVIVDEIEKASTRTDYGRIWDALLCFLEQETAARYPDPCLQVDLDLSHVMYVATANSLLPLPSPLRDRLRVIEVPEPRPRDLDRLVGPLMRDHFRARGLDERWAEALAPAERDLLAARWRGGSVRRLRAYLDVILRARDKARTLC